MDDPSFILSVRRHLESRSVALASEWLVRLRDRIPEHPRRIFPDHTLLNHMPLVLRRLAATLVGDPLWADETVRADFVALAELRRAQGYTAKEIAIELGLLRTILMDDVEDFVGREAQQGMPPVQVVQVMRALQRGVDLVEEIAMEVYKEGEGSDRTERAHMLDTFGRAVTHELRNRLNGVGLLLELVRLDIADRVREETDAKGASPIDGRFSSLKSKLHDVERVVEDVFAIAVAHGRADPCERAFESLSVVIEGTISDVREYAKQRGVTFRVVDRVPSFAVDSARVRIVLINLFSNAIKYSDASKEERWVEVRTQSTPSGCRVEVVDNGIGIPEDELQHIFGRYSRGSLVPNIDGQGIGLSLAQAAISQLGSRLDVRSQVGQGSTFFFSLVAPSSTLP